MIDMYDLPTDNELLAMMEGAAKQAKKETTVIDASDVFPGCTPATFKDNTGCVKPKEALVSNETSVAEIWGKFLKDQAAAPKSAKPLDKFENFGTVVVNSFADVPDAKKVVGSVKALKKTDIKDIQGKMTSKVEELGIGQVIVKGVDHIPNKAKLVGSVKPVSKKDLSNLSKKPEMLDMCTSTVTTVKSMDGKIKSTAQFVSGQPFAGKDLVGSIKQPKK